MNITRTAITRSLLVAALAGAVPVATATTSAQAAPYCGITWGSLAKTKAPLQAGPVTGVRSGRHACFDRLVVDLKGKAPGYTVRYVSQVTADGSGAVIPTRGGAKLPGDASTPRLHADRHCQLPPAQPRRGRQRHGLLDLPPGRRGPARSRATPRWAWASGRGCRSGSSPSRTRPTSRLVIDVAHRW